MTTESKKILITGAGSGFGLGTAKKLHAMGHTVVGTVQNQSQARELADVGIDAIQIDITEPSQIAQLEDQLPRTSY